MTIEEKILEKISEKDISTTKLAQKLEKDISQVSRELRYLKNGKALLTSTANKYFKVLNIDFK